MNFHQDMSKTRWLELMHGTGPCVHLTPEEMAAGWHWCAEWDDLLIHPLDIEYEFCDCPNHQQHKKSPEYYESLRSEIPDEDFYGNSSDGT